jgi:hypothetical protein
MTYSAEDLSSMIDDGTARNPRLSARNKHSSAPLCLLVYAQQTEFDFFNVTPDLSDVIGRKFEETGV